MSIDCCCFDKSIDVNFFYVLPAKYDKEARFVLTYAFLDNLVIVSTRIICLLRLDNSRHPAVNAKLNWKLFFVQTSAQGSSEQQEFNTSRKLLFSLRALHPDDIKTRGFGNVEKLLENVHQI